MSAIGRRWLRPSARARGPAPSHAGAVAPWALLPSCLAGMAVGLLIDSRHVSPEALIYLCSGAAGFAARVARDWTLMPATHVVMLAAAVVGIVVHERGRLPCPRRCCRHVACLGAMTVGMAASSPLASWIDASTGLPGLASLALAMGIGMATAMALTVPLYRLAR